MNHLPLQRMVIHEYDKTMDLAKGRKTMRFIEDFAKKGASIAQPILPKPHDKKGKDLT